MAGQNDGCSGVELSLAFLSGAILYAPRSGDETRTALRGYVRKTEEEVLDKAREIKGELTQTLDEAKRYLKETEATISAALAAGKEAFKKERAERS